MINPLRLEVPEQLITQRLLLRCPRPGDGAMILDAVVASLAELKVWMPWATDGYSSQDAEDWCRRASARFLLREEVAYRVFHRDDDRYMGSLSVWSKGWDVPKFEVGYWLATREVGHGYMHEAVVALTKMTFDTMQARRIEIRTDAGNSRSRRVAERAGYQLEGILRNQCVDHTGKLRDTCIYAVIRQDSTAV